MTLYDVSILGFRLNAPEPPEKALVRVFRVDPAAARAMVKRFPVVIKRGVPLDVARRFEEALIAIGAHVQLREAAPEAAASAAPLVPFASEHRVNEPREPVAPQRPSAPEPAPAAVSKGASTRMEIGPVALQAVEAAARKLSSPGPLDMPPPFGAQLEPAPFVGRVSPLPETPPIARESPAVRAPAATAFWSAPQEAPPLASLEQGLGQDPLFGGLAISEPPPWETFSLPPPALDAPHAQVAESLLDLPSTAPVLSGRTSSPLADAVGAGLHLAPHGAGTPPVRAGRFGSDLALPWLGDAEQDMGPRKPSSPTQGLAPATPKAQEPRATPSLPRERASTDPSVELGFDPPTGRRAALAEAGQASPVDAARWKPTAKGPTPLLPSPELSSELVAELERDSAVRARWLFAGGAALVLTAAALALFSVPFAAFLSSLFWCVAFSWLAYVDVKRELTGTLRMASERDAPEVYRYLRGYERWLRHHRFALAGVYRIPSQGLAFAAFRHELEPAYFALRLSAKRADFEFLSSFDSGRFLVTTTVPFTLPTDLGMFVQSYEEPLDALLLKHVTAHDRLITTQRFAPLESTSGYDGAYYAFGQRRLEVLAQIPMWPAWVLSWRFLLPRTFGGRDPFQGQGH